MKNQIQRIMRRFFPVTDRDVMDFCHRQASELQKQAPADYSAFCEVVAWSNMPLTGTPSIRLGWSSSSNCESVTSTESLSNALQKIAAKALK